MEFQGWKNYQTWSVIMNIENNEVLYNTAVRYLKKRGKNCSYIGFVRFAGLAGCRTWDGVKYTDSRVSRTEMNERLKEMAEELV